MRKTKAFKEKALSLIDAICSETSLDYFKQDAEGKVIESKESLLISQLYKLAHAACDTECDHPEWEKEVEEMYQKFVKQDLL
jgi:hypothetical protein